MIERVSVQLTIGYVHDQPALSVAVMQGMTQTHGLSSANISI